MPPEPGLYVGRDTVVDFWFAGGFGDPQRLGEIRCVLTFANRQPAVANYVKRPGSETLEPMALDVLTLAGGEIAEVITFDGATFAAFGLPETL